MPVIVSDAGPLIALSRIDKLELLRVLFRSVMVPKAVIDELRLDERRPGVVQLRNALRKGKWLESASPLDTRAIPGLGEGESGAIRLALERAYPLLVDDRRARLAADRLGVSVVGTGRILLAAKRHGLIESVGEALKALREAGYRLSDPLCRRLLELAGERRSRQ